MTAATGALPRAAPLSALWRRRGVRKAATFYLLISPWILGFVFLSAIPLALAFLMSFTNYDGLNLDYVRLVGLDNYTRAFTDADAQHALGRTLVLMVAVVPTGLVVQLALALMLNQPIRLSPLFRTIFYLPYVIPVVAGAWVWKLFTDPTGGLLNALLGLITPDANIRWLVEYPTVVLALFTIWAGAGGGMVVFLAGLQGIPAEYREAAMIDGASGAQVTRYITLPLLTPVIFFNLVIGIIAALQILVQPMLLAPGIVGLGPGTVPPSDNYLYVVHGYITIFVHQLFGYGSALLWLLFLVVVALTFVLFKTSRRWVFYGVEP